MNDEGLMGREEGETTRRRFDISAEGLRAAIKVIAEGHDALRNDVVLLKGERERLQNRLEVRRPALETRQGT